MVKDKLVQLEPINGVYRYKDVSPKVKRKTPTKTPTKPKKSKISPKLKKALIVSGILGASGIAAVLAIKALKKSQTQNIPPQNKFLSKVIQMESVYPDDDTKYIIQLNKELKKAGISTGLRNTKYNACDAYKTYTKHIQSKCKFDNDQKKCKTNIINSKGISESLINESIKKLKC
jgi:hypothetical protein